MPPRTTPSPTWPLLGHRRIAFVAGTARSRVGARQRLEGFHAALDCSRLAPGALYEGDFSYAAGQAAALRMLAESQMPDAVACANDETAIGVLMGLRGSRRRGAGRNLGDGSSATRGRGGSSS